MEEEKPNPAKAEATEDFEQSSSSSEVKTVNDQANRPNMSNTLVNLRACVK